MKTSPYFLTLLVFSLIAVSGVTAATQIIVLNDTEEKAYGLNEITITGDLSENRLQLRGTGEVISGENVKVYLVGPSADVLVSNLQIDSVPKPVSFDENGYFFIADKGTFSYAGTLEIRTIGQLRLYIRGPANMVSFKLENGYSIDGDLYGAYDKEVIIQRAKASPMLVDGSFHYIYAERDTFQYIVNLKSFGSSLGNYVLDLPNNEVVSSVQGAIKWEQQGNTLVLDLESESANLIIDGLFNSNNIRVPLKNDRHNVLIESDPEKKITVSTSAQETDLKESSISPRYSNARAFLASAKEVINVQVQKLGIMPSLAASVSYASNRIAVSETGSILGELNYQYSNTGVDYIELDAPGTPLYAGTDGSAVKLTKDQDKVFLTFPKGQRRNLDYVYFTTRAPIKPVDLIEIPLARSDLPITTITTSIYLPQEYMVLYTFGAKGGSELPGAELVIMFLIVVGIIGYSLIRDKKFLLYYLLLSIGIFSFNVTLFLFFLILSAIWILKKHIISKNQNLLGIIAGAIILILVVGAGLIGLFMVGQSGSLHQKSLSYQTDSARVTNEAALPQMKGMDVIGSEEGAISVPIREGVLPVKFELPSLGKEITVTNHLVTKEKQLSLKVLVIADYFKYLLYLIAALAAVKAYKIYNKK
ncbi:MAG: hypothetical protein WAX07_07805 [Candidatus Altiarchaeia archaeon]